MDTSSGSSSLSRSSGALKKCNCGLPAKIYKSKTEKNPGRRFFGCQLYKDGGSEHCKFFKWYDEEEVQGWPRNALTKAVAEIREKEKVIEELQMTIMGLHSELEKQVEDAEKVIEELQMTIMGLRSELEKQVEDAEKVVYRQRLVITGLAGLLVCVVGGIIFA